MLLLAQRQRARLLITEARARESTLKSQGECDVAPPFIIRNYHSKSSHKNRCTASGDRRHVFHRGINHDADAAAHVNTHGPWATSPARRACCHKGGRRLPHALLSVKHNHIPSSDCCPEWTACHAYSVQQPRSDRALPSACHVCALYWKKMAIALCHSVKRGVFVVIARLALEKLLHGHGEVLFPLLRGNHDNRFLAHGRIAAFLSMGTWAQPAHAYSLGQPLSQPNNPTSRMATVSGADACSLGVVSA